jgi:hypothetical protein
VFGGRKIWFAVALGLTVVGLGGVASSASATFHAMKVREVSPGTNGSDDSFIEVQMYAPGQNFLSNGAKLAVCNNICSLVPAEFTGFTDVANGANQATVVFGDSGVPAGSKDFNVNLNLQDLEAGGAACYVSEPGFSDCVSWGNFTANSTLTADYDSSANPGGPAAALVSGMALRRSIAAGCPTALEALDDTNNSAADFSQTTPNPRPNSAPITELLCAPPGNPTSPINPAGNVRKRKCKKHKAATAPTPPAYAAKKKKCKKKKHR